MGRKGTASSEHYSIGAIARAAGVSTQTIRLWEKRGQIESIRSKGGHRLFAAAMLDRAAELAATSRRLRQTVNRGADPDSDSMSLASTGMRIRSARLERGLSQAEAAQRIGISRSFLATVERGESGVSTRVLTKIAETFEISMTWFAEVKGLDGRLMRSDERPRTLLSGGVAWEELVAPGSHELEPAMLSLPPGEGGGGVVVRASEAFVLVLEGSMEFRVGEQMEVLLLDKGDSIIIDPGTPFSWRNPGRVAARCVWVEFNANARRKAGS